MTTTTQTLTEPAARHLTLDDLRVTGRGTIRLSEQQTATLEDRGARGDAFRRRLAELAREMATRIGESVLVLDAEGNTHEQYAAEATDITDDQITALRTEAGAHGDAAQIAICDAALSGDEDARRECARVIADAAAQG